MFFSFFNIIVYIGIFGCILISILNFYLEKYSKSKQTKYSGFVKLGFRWAEPDKLKYWSLAYPGAALPPIIIVRGTMFLFWGLVLIRLYMVIMWRMFKSCLLYSWIRLTWMSNTEAGLILTPVKMKRWNYWIIMVIKSSLIWNIVWKPSLRFAGKKCGLQ